VQQIEHLVVEHAALRRRGMAIDIPTSSTSTLGSRCGAGSICAHVRVRPLDVPTALTRPSTGEGRLDADLGVKRWTPSWWPEQGGAVADDRTQACTQVGTGLRIAESCPRSGQIPDSENTGFRNSQAAFSVRGAPRHGDDQWHLRPCEHPVRSPEPRDPPVTGSPASRSAAPG
jgi:hypothetical protein